MRVVRSRRRFRMVLHRKERKLAVANAFDGAVVEVEVGDLECRSTRHTAFVADYRKSVVLRGDEHPAGLHVAHRMVAAAVTVRKLRGLASEGDYDQLMP